MTDQTEILTVHALTEEPDEDDPNQILIIDAEKNLVATIYMDEHAITVRLPEELPIAMADLEQAYRWIVTRRLASENAKHEVSE